MGRLKHGLREATNSALIPILRPTLQALLRLRFAFSLELHLRQAPQAILVMVVINPLSFRTLP